jgi:hypothetical protein
MAIKYKSKCIRISLTDFPTDGIITKDLKPYFLEVCENENKALKTAVLLHLSVKCFYNDFSNPIYLNIDCNEGDPTTSLFMKKYVLDNHTKTKALFIMEGNSKQVHYPDHKLFENEDPDDTKTNYLKNHFNKLSLESIRKSILNLNDEKSYIPIDHPIIQYIENNKETLAVGPDVTNRLHEKPIRVDDNQYYSIPKNITDQIIKIFYDHMRDTIKLVDLNKCKAILGTFPDKINLSKDSRKKRKFIMHLQFNYMIVLDKNMIEDTE